MPTIIDLIKEMKKLGYSDEQIINYLKQQGIEPKEILDAFKQVEFTSEMIPSIMETQEEMPQEEVPTPTKEGIFQTIEKPALEKVPQPQIIPTVPYTTETPETIVTGYGYDIETFETLAEEIIKEKFELLKKRIGDIEELRKNINLKIKDIEERLKRVELNIDKIYMLILKRQEEQQKEIKTIGKEISMLEKAFSKILEPLSENIKKLEEISKELKKK